MGLKKCERRAGSIHAQSGRHLEGLGEAGGVLSKRLESCRCKFTLGGAGGAIAPVTFEAPHFFTNPQVAYQRPSSAMPSVVSWKKVAEPPGTRPSAAVASVRAARASSASPRTPRPIARREFLRY